MVEGTPLLREHLGKTWIEGSNPSVSASDFFQYFNPSSICLQAADLIELFLPKLSVFLK